MDNKVDNLRQDAPSLSVQQDEIELRAIFAMLMDGRRIIGIITGVLVFCALLYAIFALPIYSPLAILQVDQKVGGLTGLETLSSLVSGSATPTNAEIQILQTRAVVGTALQSLHRETRITPDYFPLLGELVSRLKSPSSPAGAWPGFSRFSWGGDTLQTDMFDVPADQYKEKFTLVATGKGSYDLFDPDDNLLIQGRAGVAQSVHMPGEDPADDTVTLRVTTMSARPGVHFTLRRYDIQEVLKDTLEQMTVQEQGQQSGVIEVNLDGHYRQQVTDLLHAIVQAALDLNIRVRAENAQQEIDFLQNRLPDLKQRVIKARIALADYQSKHKVMDLSDQVQALLTELGQLDSQIVAADMQQAQLEQQFGPGNPALKSAYEQQRQLAAKREALNVELAKMPQGAQEMFALQSELEIANGLYTTLLSNIEQLQVAKAGTVGDVHVIDQPVLPYKPSGPYRLLTVLLALVAGVLLGCMVVLFRRTVMQGVEDPALLEAKLGLPVYAVVPHSSDQENLRKRLAQGGGKGHQLLVKEFSDSIVAEALRGLRTSVQLALMRVERPVICVSGPTAGIGKSFISANFGFVMAQANQRVLVVDADMRRGHLHTYYGLRGDTGLAQLLAGNAKLEEVVQKTELPGLEFISCGGYPPNPSELLLTQRVQDFLDRVVGKYDCIIIDAPPVLAVTDAIIIGRRAGINLLLAKYAEHTLRELEAMVQRYRHGDIEPDGFIFNDLQEAAGSYGYYRYGYRYVYKYEKD